MSWGPDLVDVPGWVYTVAWGLWVAWFFVWESLALLDGDLGDTFTEHTRPWLRGNELGWLLGALFFAWLVWHYLIE